MKRDDLLAGLAARRFHAPSRSNTLQQCFEAISRPRRIGSVGEVLERLRHSQRARDRVAVVRIGGDDCSDRQMLERRETCFDLHPLASVPIHDPMTTPTATPAHRLSGGAK